MRTSHLILPALLIVACQAVAAEPVQISTTTLEVPGRLIGQVMASIDAGRSDDDPLYRELVRSFEQGEVGIVSHLTTTCQADSKAEFSAQRAIAAPSYFNMGHLDWAQRYNPRDIGNGLATGTHVRVVTRTDRRANCIGADIEISYSHGKTVDRLYGARVDGLGGHGGWPACIELPAFPRNTIRSNLKLPLSGERILAAVTRPVEPAPGKADRLGRPDIYHLTFVHVSNGKGRADKQGNPKNETHWAAVYEIATEQLPGIDRVTDLPAGSQPVDFALVTTSLGAPGLAQSSAAFAYPDALLLHEAPAEGTAIGKTPTEPRPFQHDGGVDGARGDFSRNLNTRELRVGTAFIAVPGPLGAELKLRRIARPPALREVKLAYPIGNHFATGTSRWVAANFEQFQIDNEDGSHSTNLDGGASGPVELGHDAEQGTTRIIFFGSRKP